MFSIPAAEIKIIEKKSGLSIAKIRDICPSALRKHLEKKTGRKIKASSKFPLIGRGNVLRENLISREDLEKELDDILK